MIFGRIKSVRKKEDQIDVIKLHTQTRPEEELFDALDGGVLLPPPAPGAPLSLAPEGNTLEAWVIVDGQLTPDTEVLHGKFYSAECYIFIYTWLKKSSQALRYQIYLWQGAQSRKQDRGQAALMVKDIVTKVRKRGGSEPNQERIVQYKEPAQFCMLFKDRMVVYRGRLPSSLASSGSKKKGSSSSSGSSTPAKANLFQVHSSSDPLRHRAIQIPLEGSMLNSKDVFLLQQLSSSGNTNAVFVWMGLGSSEELRQSGRLLARQLPGAEPSNIKELAEGDEAKKFWKLLGGKQTYTNIAYLQKPGKERIKLVVYLSISVLEISI
jgi:hypothetical protein